MKWYRNEIAAISKGQNEAHTQYSGGRILRLYVEAMLMQYAPASWTTKPAPWELNSISAMTVSEGQTTSRRRFEKESDLSWCWKLSVLPKKVCRFTYRPHDIIGRNFSVGKRRRNQFYVLKHDINDTSYEPGIEQGVASQIAIYSFSRCELQKWTKAYHLSDIGYVNNGYFIMVLIVHQKKKISLHQIKNRQ